MTAKRIYIRLLLRAGACLLLLAIMDWGIGSLLRTYYFRQQSGLQYRTTYALEKTRADVLFFGSSRCNHHYNPLIFEDSLKLSCYNAGRDGNRLPYHYAVLKSILARYTPKIIILDLLADDFEENPEAYERLSALLPYYRTHPEIRSVVEMRGPFEQFKMTSSVYPYNSSLITIALGNRKKTEDIKGYLPLSTKWNGVLSNPQQVTKSKKLDRRKVNIYMAFLKICRTRDVKLFVTVSPYYGSLKKTSTLLLAGDIATQNKVPFFDFSQATAFLRTPHYFSDPTHLNTEGAKCYSNAVIQKMLNNDKYSAGDQSIHSTRLAVR